MSLFDDDDICPRCGKNTDGGARAIWMACTAGIGEIEKIPTVKCMMTGWVGERDGTEEVRLGDGYMIMPAYKKPDVARELPTNRLHEVIVVCEDCRDAWMDAIGAWYHDPTIGKE